ncbi:mechanosensitive ion channel family protein [Desulfococcaceae bacterium HSG8]|nr:mechanosensitive ion channel family protein [Desulfococcaceae bacterium HSG8]
MEEMSYSDLVIDLAILLISLLLGTILARVFPGYVRKEKIASSRVEEIEIKRSHFRLFRAGYVAIIAWIIHKEIGLIESVFPDFIPAHFVQVEGKLSIFWFLFWFALLLIHGLEYSLRWVVQIRKKLSLPSLLMSIVRIFLIMGAIIVIGQNVLDWHPTTLLASTAILSMVFGLAFKKTLSDLLAGISLNLTHAIIPSQWIRIPSPRFPDSMISGEVLSTNWRETRVRTTAGHVYIIPNSQLAGSVVHNMSWPDKVRRHAMDFFVCNHVHPDLISEALLSCLGGNAKILDSYKKSQVLVTGYQEFSIRYTLRFWTETYHDSAGLEAGIRRKVWDAFEKRGIQLPVVPEIRIHKGKSLSEERRDCSATRGDQDIIDI